MARPGASASPAPGMGPPLIQMHIHVELNSNSKKCGVHIYDISLKYPKSKYGIRTYNHINMYLKQRISRYHGFPNIHEE